MHKLRYFVLGALTMLLVLFLFGKLKTGDTGIGRYQITAFPENVNLVWILDTKTGVVKQYNVEGTQRGGTIDFSKEKP